MINRWRILLLLIMIGASIYAAAGLMESLTQFGIGGAIALTAYTCWGLLEWIER